MRIIVIGAGAIGCLFGLYLQRAGHSVVLIHHRKRMVAAIRRRGVAVRELSGKLLSEHIEIKSAVSKSDRPDLVLITVKAYDTESAVRSLRSIGLEAPVLSLQNGLGNIETMRRYVLSQRLLAGTTTEGAQAAGAGRINHTGRGITWIGGVNEGLTRSVLDVNTVLRRAGFKTEASRNIEGVIWSKAIVNSAINPISALARIVNGEILGSPALRDLALKVVREGVRVARAQGVTLQPSPESMIIRVLSSTSANKSSMLQDIEAGRTTEIRQLNGRISALGKKLMISTPYNEMLTALTLGAEMKRLKP